MIKQRYNLNLIPDKVPVIVNCSQYDALSRTIEMVIYDGSTVYDIPSGTSASVRGTKQDNTGFEYPCTIDGSIVSFDIQDQMTIFAGRVPCEIRLSKDGGIIGTCNFLLNVEETPLDPDVTISETDLPLLEEAEQNAIRAEQARDEAEQILSSTVKSVNGETPDANGNVDVIALPTGGTTGQVLTKQSSADRDANWQNIPPKMDFVSSPTANDILLTDANGQAIDSGRTLSEFQELLTAGRGIDIVNNEISAEYDDLSTNFDINDVIYDYMGYVSTATNGPAGYTSGMLLSVASESGGNTMQIFHHYNSDRIYVRYYRQSGSGWSEWQRFMTTQSDSLWVNESSDSSFAAQTISLDLAQYLFVVIVFRQSTTGSIHHTVIAKPNGFDHIAFSPLTAGTTMYKRTYTPRSTGVQFYAGRSDATEDNTKMIPRYIYGIK